ncbi:hypothetical protein QNI19_35860 [Cytophagaceae bacterium DM2B3-1]|uniref:Integral membrane protein n=2 Tax=Xanthocytophaga flava TaxID=3048013 RepID=A0ABT7CXY8_9BACT|nr:hypothetical protein [Xanthocytophaga flavus]MDJ1467509.1 hypothetical protein [Xanthocytophaga flavus]MDJ1498366.1 hypothetical protein [Xanthocytophaga flavus]
MNVIAYLIYLAITYWVTVHVGLSFYKHGRLYLLSLFHNDEKISDSINRLLLVGYYLLNLGYVAIMIRFWDSVTSWQTLVASVSTMVGKIMLTLAIIHFINMTVLLFFSKSYHTSTHSK